MAESERKYLFDRLDHLDFQQLVSALLALQYQNFRALPLGQADGGRDGVTVENAGDVIVFQDKWTKRHERDPVKWLSAAVEAEAESVARLGGKGVKRYLLITNHPSTGKSDSGTFDRMRTLMDGYEERFGIESMDCVWRETLNAWVDNAPSETKWAFAEMLAGWDLVRYLVSESLGDARTTELRRLIRKLAEVHWESDDRVRFSQVDVDRQRVADLFVDVNGHRFTAGAGAPEPASTIQSVNRIARHLVGARDESAILRGAPGQGKSTLTQYVSQCFRAPFVGAQANRDGLIDVYDEPVRFPIRIELGEFAAWRSGEDIFADSGKRVPQRKGAAGTIDAFLRGSFAHASGRKDLTSKMVDDLLDLVPCIFILDGLDEVGSGKARKNVVEEIDRFAAASRGFTVPARVLVTTRPNASELPEPDRRLFDLLGLDPFTEPQITEYMQKWSAVNGLRAAEGRAVRKAFKAKAGEPYIGELASNPMQLTILLDLLNREGDATPTDRTELYDQYVALLLTREANKHPASVKKHQKELREIMPFLGWYLQSRTEEAQSSGRMTEEEISAAMKHFQATYARKESIVAELLEAASDRLWALTSKDQGTYEFDIQSLQEYFAAGFLFKFAGEDDSNFDRAEVLRELLKRPFWLNTARFYGGHARQAALSELSSGLCDDLIQEPSRQTLTGAWTLLSDGVFSSRPLRAADVLTATTSRDQHLVDLLTQLANRQISPMVGEPEDIQFKATWERLTDEIAAAPDRAVTGLKVDVLHRLLPLGPSFDEWWRSELRSKLGTEAEEGWLRLGGRHESGAGVTTEALGAVQLEAGGAENLLNTGLSLEGHPDLRDRALASIMDGQCGAVRSIKSVEGQIAVALSPEAFFTSSNTGFVGRSESLESQRSAAVRALAKVASPYAQIARRRRFGTGQRGSTFPWANVAADLYAERGRCWLASEIASIGAAHPHRFGGPKVPDTAAFGPDSHPTTLLREVRANRTRSRWWEEEVNRIDSADSLALAEWVFALWSNADVDTFLEFADRGSEVIRGVGDNRRYTLRAAMTRWRDHGLRLDHRFDAFDDALEIESSTTLSPDGGAAARDPNDLPPLAVEARSKNWFLVDAHPTYR